MENHRKRRIQEAGKGGFVLWKTESDSEVEPKANLKSQKRPKRWSFPRGVTGESQLDGAMNGFFACFLMKVKRKLTYDD